MAARPGTATPKSAATREKIMAAATSLMAERGSADFQMAEVSARCGMSKGSLYYYFSDRAELVRAVLDRAVDDLWQASRGSSPRRPQQRTPSLACSTPSSRPPAREARSCWPLPGRVPAPLRSRGRASRA